jgi:hypothetical protein
MKAKSAATVRPVWKRRKSRSGLAHGDKVESYRASLLLLAKAVLRQTGLTSSFI